MPHIQEIPAQAIIWEHLQFQGRRLGRDNPRRYWGIVYAPFANQEDADAFPDASILEGWSEVSVRIYGELVDRFFWDSGIQQFVQTENRVGACLQWIFTANPTQHELDLTDGLDAARRAMVGTQLFDGAITVLPLPPERAT